MAVRGVKPLPTALKVIRGTLRPGRDAGRADVRVHGPIEPLAPLAPLTEHESRYFEFYRTHAVPGAHGAIDSHLFTQIARVAARLDVADQKVQQFGMVMKNPKTGKPEVQPYEATSRALRDQLRKLLSEAGLTPAARTRLPAGAGKEPAESGWDDID